jgi:hypothetical protein
VPTLDHDSDTAWRDHGVNRLRYLPSQPFLDLKPVRVSVDQAGQLAETYDSTVWNVADVGAPKEGKQMVLTQTEERDVLHDHHIVVTVKGEDGITHDARWVGGIARGEVSKGFSDPAWSLKQTLAVWILAQLLEEGGHHLGELVTGRRK